MDKNLLARATSYDDTPTPGYMYGEISKITITSYEACRQLEEYLISRLRKNNHNVKYKCLVIIKHVCRTGRAEFKRDMQRQTEVRGRSQPSQPSALLVARGGGGKKEGGDVTFSTVQVIRECLQYRGPPDPLKGDQIYKRVQEAAKEALDSIYDSEMPSTIANPAVAHRIEVNPRWVARIYRR
jgi:hypothetical protein